MGLSFKEWKRRNELLEVLKEFGITEDDLKYLPTALKLVKENSLQNKPVELSAEDKKAIQEKYYNKLTPEDIVKAFAGDVEELYPNGRPRQTTNNN